MAKKYIFIDPFDGSGGFSERFLQTGKFEGFAYVECESPTIITLRQRHVDKRNHLEDDVKKIVWYFTEFLRPLSEIPSNTAS